MIYFFLFFREQDLIVHANCLPNLPGISKPVFWKKKTKKTTTTNISICRLLKFLPRVLCIKYGILDVHLSAYRRHIDSTENLSVACFIFDILGRANRKGVLDQAQLAEIHIHTAHAQSFIRAFALHSYILLCPMTLSAD